MSDETGGYLVAHPMNRVCGLVHPNHKWINSTYPIHHWNYNWSYNHLLICNNVLDRSWLALNVH